MALLMVVNELYDVPNAVARVLEERQFAHVLQRQIQSMRGAVYPKDVREPAMQIHQLRCMVKYAATLHI